MIGIQSTTLKSEKSKYHFELIFQAGRGLIEYQNQAKQLFRKMNQGSPNRGSLETGPYLFQ